MSELESLASHEPLAQHLTRHSIDRLIMLSDGVFAIAITLAAIEIHVPPAASLADVIADMNVALLAYFTSFVVIAVFWTSNRDLFARVERVDRPLTVLVLGTLCLTALIPASVRMTGPAAGTLGGAFRFYALIMTISGTLNLTLWIYASFRSSIMSPQVSRNYRLRKIIKAATLPFLFACIFVMPTAEMLKWVAVLMSLTLGLRRLLFRRFLRDDHPNDALAAATAE